MTKTIKISAVLFLAFSAIACSNPEPATCSRSGDDAIACTASVADCIADGNGTCKTDGPGDLELHADGTFRQEFGAYEQIGTYIETPGNLQLTSDGQIVGNVGVTSAE